MLLSLSGVYCCSTISTFTLEINRTTWVKSWIFEKSTQTFQNVFLYWLYCTRACLVSTCLCKTLWSMLSWHDVSYCSRLIGFWLGDVGGKSSTLFRSSVCFFKALSCIWSHHPAAAWILLHTMQTRGCSMSPDNGALTKVQAQKSLNHYFKAPLNLFYIIHFTRCAPSCVIQSLLLL